ncbi:WYL domain-containing protein [Shewanella sp. 0m-8]
MDYSYFLNDAGDYTAKRLQAPKTSAIKFKDMTDLADFRFELKDCKPSSEDQFVELYNNFFDSTYSYDVEVESFSEAVTANRNKFLGSNTWLKRLWDDIEYLYDPDENEDEYEWQAVDDSVASALIKADLAVKKTELEQDDWSNYFYSKTVAELKSIAKPLGIKVSQVKSGLVKDLLACQDKNEWVVPLPTIIKLKPQLKIFIQEIQSKYINELEVTLLKGNYPRAYQALIWKEVADFDTYCFVQMLAKDKLTNFNDVDGVVEKSIEYSNDDYSIFFSESHEGNTPSVDEIMEQKTTNETVSKLDNSVRIIFDYIDSSGQSSNREFRLDKIIQADNTYLHGFCFLRNAARHFRLDRIQGDIIIKDTGEVVSKNYCINYFGGKTVKPNEFNKTSTKKTSSTEVKYETSTFSADSLNRTVSPLLFIGIFIMPIIFSWFTLRQGHSLRSKIVSFSWLICTLLLSFSGEQNT